MIVLLSVLLLACTPDNEKDAFTAGEVEDPGAPLDSGTTDATDDTPVLEVWGMLQSTRSLVDDPVGPGTDTTDTRAVSLLRWTRTGTSVVWESTLCSLTSTEVYGTITSFPEAFVAHYPVVTRAGELAAAATGAAFTAGPFVDVIGARLDAPDDPLPTSSRDARQWDQDEDGQPGMTVQVEQAIFGEGEVYVAQRTSSTLEGTVLRSDRIEGYVRDFDQEQVLYDVSAWWLEIPTNNRADTTLDANWFVLQRLDDPEADCAGLEATQRSVFGR
jgi:hypothetical protein